MSRRLDRGHRRQIQHDNGSGKFIGNDGKLLPELDAGELILQRFQKRFTLELPFGVERKAQIFGERAFARAVKAGHPDTDFMAGPSGEAVREIVQQTLVMAGQTVGDFILTDFAFKLVLRGPGVIDDRSDLPVNRAGLVKDFANDIHGDSLG